MSKCGGKNQRRRRHLKRLFEHQKGKCWICDLQMFLYDGKNGNDDRTASIDHIKMRVQGGTLNDETKAAHRWCNAARHQWSCEEIRKEMIKKFSSVSPMEEAAVSKTVHV